jgi:hypothetical protein
MLPLDGVFSGGLPWVPVSHKRGRLGKPKLEFRSIAFDLVKDRMSENAFGEFLVSEAGDGSKVSGGCFNAMVYCSCFGIRFWLAAGIDAKRRGRN